jgi:DNA-3-methyladenine glycosylase
MFGPPGRAYVYLVYGMYDCLNVVTESEGNPAAVLVRAVEPIDGADQMRMAREEHPARKRAHEPRKIAESRLASGPGLVCVAFSITRADDGVDLLDPASDLRLEESPPGEHPDVATSPRIGIDYAPEPWLSQPWRFFVPGNPAVSRSAIR